MNFLKSNHDGVTELADESDSKSDAGTGVRVQIPLPSPERQLGQQFLIWVNYTDRKEKS